MSRGALCLRNPTVDQEPMFARQHVDAVLADVQDVAIHFPQRHCDWRARGHTRIAADTRDLVVRPLRTFVCLQRQAAAQERRAQESNGDRLHAPGGSVADVASTSGMISFVPVWIAPRSRSGLYWRRSQIGML